MWRPDLFDRLLTNRAPWNMGRRVLYERSHICTCKNARSGSPSANCQFCFGTGHCYDTPTPITLGVSGYSVNRDWKAFGPMPAGTCVFTIPVNQQGTDGEYARSKIYDEIGDFDRFTLADESERREIVLEKDKDDNHGQPALVKVLGLHVSRGAEPELTFVEGVDYVIDGMRVRWVLGPLKGTQYVLEVLANPVLYVFNSRVMHRNHGSVELPKKILAAPADVLDRARRIGSGNGT